MKGGGCYLGDEKYKSKQSNRTNTFKNINQISPIVNSTHSAPNKVIAYDLTSPQRIRVEITPA